MVSPSHDAWSKKQPSWGRAGRCHVYRHVAWMLLAIWMCPRNGGAEEPIRHLTLRSDTPPGAIGRQQLLRGGPLRGYSQPVEIRAPQGALISPVQGGSFTEPYAAPMQVGLQLGYAYRLRISQIPQLDDVVLFPSIELIDRTYPPDDKKWDYPIPIEMTSDELRMAAAGKLITRVIYIEDPETALPVSEKRGGDQRFFEALPGEDPLQVAAELGRPVAILRLGARGPDDNEMDPAFTFGSPPVELLAPRTAPLAAPPAPLFFETVAPDLTPASARRSSAVKGGRGVVMELR